MTDTCDINMVNFLKDSLNLLKSSEAQDFKEFDKVFKCNKMSSIIPLLETGLFSNSAAPEYNSSIDYTKQTNKVKTELNSNIKCLKDKCIEKSWLES